ncbi:hypothetical protein PsYK624_163710 [Phanerochaete sordida]|uniref:F-box domain-containing protein n=1 Tax=Phanerochaete sordida TaxID=48140 RepID=A0A9P3LM13_9APHY|nr:hypothetical protein PsYK624_163710 [Phanerochaete sordida]
MSNPESGAATFTFAKHTHNIFSLPVELLHIIFSAVLTGSFWAFRDDDPSSDETNVDINVAKVRTELQLVCKLWQSSVLSCPGLWAYIDLEFLSPDAVWRSVRLAGSAPLWLSSIRRTLRGAGERSEVQDAELAAELLEREGHRIAVLLLSAPVYAEVSTRAQTTPLTLPREATALQYLELSIPEEHALASDPLWPLLLARAPNLTFLKLSGMSHQPCWAALSTSAPITRLRYLTLQCARGVALADLASLLRRLRGLQDLTLRDVGFVESTQDAAVALENACAVELPRLRSLRIENMHSTIFCLLRKLALPPHVRVILHAMSMDGADTAAVLRGFAQVAARIPPADVYDLSLRLGESHLEVYGHRRGPTRFAEIHLPEREPALVLQLGWAQSPADPHPTAVHFVRGICACLPLEHARLLTLRLPSMLGAVHAAIGALRPVFARLVHVEEVYVDDSVNAVCMASLRTLLRVDDGEPAPLPQLAALWFEKWRPWCPECAADFMRDLCEVLRARATGGLPIARVLVQSWYGLNVPDDVAATVRALVPEFSEKVTPPESPWTARHICIHKMEGVKLMLVEPGFPVAIA